MKAYRYTALWMLNVGGLKFKVFSVHATTAYRGRRGRLHSFLTWAVDESEWLNSRPGRFATVKETRNSLNRRIEPIWTFRRRKKPLASTGNIRGNLSNQRLNSSTQLFRTEFAAL
jgi:hypothetical protein